MSQNAIVLPTSGTVSGLQMTQDTNNALDTLNTLWSGASAPGSPEAGQLWHDTTNNILKLRSLDNTSWIPLFSLNESAYTSTIANSTLSLGTSTATTAAAGTNTTQIATTAFVQNTLAAVPDTDNRFVNPNMIFDQVNEGTATTPGITSARVYVVDQWAHYATQAGKLTYQQDSFGNAAGLPSEYILNISVASAATAASTDQYILCQPIEGCNVCDLSFGNAGAQNILLSFWMYSSLAGTFAGSIQNSAANRSCPFTFVLGSASQWTLITLSIPGDTTGTWLKGRGQIGLNFILDLGSGTNFNGTVGAWAGGNYTRTSSAVSFVANAGASMYVTGFCLRPGSSYGVAAFPSVAKQLADCQRYAEKSYDIGVTLGAVTGNNGGIVTFDAANTNAVNTVQFRVSKMTDPTVTLYSNNSGASGKWYNNGGATDVSASVLGVGANSFSSDASTTSGVQYSYHFLATARL